MVSSGVRSGALGLPVTDRINGASTLLAGGQRVKRAVRCRPAEDARPVPVPAGPPTADVA